MIKTLKQVSYVTVAPQALRLMSQAPRLTPGVRPKHLKQVSYVTVAQLRYVERDSIREVTINPTS